MWSFAIHAGVYKIGLAGVLPHNLLHVDWLLGSKVVSENQFITA
jgi:hypothetical protein